MEVKLLKEHDDGSVTFRFELTGEEIESFVILGIRAALEAGINKGKEWHDREADLGNT